MSAWEDWIGREEVRVERLDRARSDALTAALGDPPNGGAVMPHLHHWLHFWDVRPPSGLGPDGHPAKGGFLPPIPLPRRMWAGGRLTFLTPLRFGETVERRSVIRAVEAKSGRSGDLVFVTVAHTLTGPHGVALEEEQDLVYRAAAPAPAPDPGPEDALPTADWSRVRAPDPVLLFRYSALTMNGHRIHYDRPYAQTVEHYRGLVVQGPLQATMMLGEAERRQGRAASRFAFRGLAPAFEGAALSVSSAGDDPTRTWIAQAGRRTMTGEIQWADPA